ncbi:hypothetical protein PAHAL_7G237100 [Panicum hallii]|uniref:Uncharacterized protein n=1 Tax=Panicum hallii TaxID=206008 RepID=A0A2T8ID91_9POAL|nr:hypothetical protein PAHAL_7G237100 [Panicum hallii]
MGHQKSNAAELLSGESSAYTNVLGRGTHVIKHKWYSISMIASTHKTQGLEC